LSTAQPAAGTPRRAGTQELILLLYCRFKYHIYILRRVFNVRLHFTRRSAPACHVCAWSPRVPASRAKILSQASALSESVEGCRRVSKTFCHMAGPRFAGVI
jgi:hypothetical protein